VSTHTHPCSHCTQPTSCDAELVQNFDGIPAVVCQAFHVDRVLALCEPCEMKRAMGVCEDCGVWGDEPHDADCTMRESCIYCTARLVTEPYRPFCGPECAIDAQREGE
jgi:hypothetical protein